mmetsp:Transcript_5957/g.20876  ORF Transcript_5957/g.20876 Transcript_5957/m.20876 type:complete len:556 (-) Transcript_5957:1032-2699(-)
MANRSSDRPSFSDCSFALSSRSSLFSSSDLASFVLVSSSFDVASSIFCTASARSLCAVSRVSRRDSSSASFAETMASSSATVFSRPLMVSSRSASRAMSSRMRASASESAFNASSRSACAWARSVLIASRFAWSMALCPSSFSSASSSLIWRCRFIHSPSLSLSAMSAFRFSFRASSSSSLRASSSALRSAFSFSSAATRFVFSNSSFWKASACARASASWRCRSASLSESSFSLESSVTFTVLTIGMSDRRRLVTTSGTWLAFLAFSSCSCLVSSRSAPSAFAKCDPRPPATLSAVLSTPSKASPPAVSRQPSATPDSLSRRHSSLAMYCDAFFSNASAASRHFTNFSSLSSKTLILFSSIPTSILRSSLRSSASSLSRSCSSLSFLSASSNFCSLSVSPCSPSIWLCRRSAMSANCASRASCLLKYLFSELCSWLSHALPCSSGSTSCEGRDSLSFSKPSYMVLMASTCSSTCSCSNTWWLFPDLNLSHKALSRSNAAVCSLACSFMTSISSLPWSLFSSLAASSFFLRRSSSASSSATFAFAPSSCFISAII